MTSRASKYDIQIVRKVLDTVAGVKYGGLAMNLNQHKLSAGFLFRLEVFNARMGRSEPEFTTCLKDARTRRKALRAAGYSTTIFAITATGGLRGIS